MGYWLRGHEGERNSFGKIQLVGQKYRDKTTESKTLILFLPPKIRRFSLLVAYNI